MKMCCVTRTPFSEHSGSLFAHVSPCAIVIFCLQILEQSEVGIFLSSICHMRMSCCSACACVTRLVWQFLFGKCTFFWEPKEALFGTPSSPQWFPTFVSRPFIQHVCICGHVQCVPCPMHPSVPPSAPRLQLVPCTFCPLIVCTFTVGRRPPWGRRGGGGGVVGVRGPADPHSPGTIEDGKCLGTTWVLALHVLSSTDPLPMLYCSREGPANRDPYHWDPEMARMLWAMPLLSALGIPVQWRTCRHTPFSTLETQIRSGYAFWSLLCHPATPLW